MNVRDLAGELHGRRHHVHTLLRVAETKEDVAEQDQAAAGQPVEVLSVGHLECLPQVSLTLPVLRGEERLEPVDVVRGRLH